ncbi:MAG: hypothetical protein HQK53_03090 [Oligoflexia bacterium]|nr:hypothetical protein [Oligoflexia bacterium]
MRHGFFYAFVILLLTSPLFYSFASVSIYDLQPSVLEVIDRFNTPDILGELTIITDPEQLPAEGKSSKEVWTGPYFPVNNNGTAVAMKKYDIATNNGGRAYNWESENNRRIGNVSWAGHCNGLAAAAINERGPKHSVNYHGVTFSVDDIKALLVEAYQNSTGVSRLVGLRCNSDSSATDSYGRNNDPSCRDLNPASFHLIITNYLGIHGMPVIIDENMGLPVWNYAIKKYSYSYKILDARGAATALGADRYIFNRDAKYFLKVHMTLQSASGKSFKYDYILEGSEQQQIVGGEWLGKSKSEHPDFIWRQNQMNTENPYLNIEVIKEIASYAQ